MDSSIAAPAYVRGSDLLGEALAVAAAAHRGQTRHDGSPYLAHPLRVCELLAEAGADETTLAAALLHDGSRTPSSPSATSSSASGSRSASWSRR